MEDVWVEWPFGNGWRVAYRLLPRAGQAVIGELRIFPDSPELPNREPGTWAGEFLGIAAKCPRGGVTARLLRDRDLKVGARRSVPAGIRQARQQRAGQRFDPRRYEEYRAIARQIDPATPVLPPSSSAEWVKDFDDELRALGVSHSTPTARSNEKKRGRPGRSEGFYALLAAAYVSRLDAGSVRPIADLVADEKLRVRLGVSSRAFQRSHVRDAIRIAREKGLLSESDAGPGKSGGALTDRAKALLRESSGRPNLTRAKGRKRRHVNP